MRQDLRRGHRQRQRISIHSSQTGWDLLCSICAGNFMKFQSTHPKRDETSCTGRSACSSLISIHSSQTGWDHLIYTELDIGDKISIHSSQTGWDYQSSAAVFFGWHFNPLIPNGMRHKNLKQIHHYFIYPQKEEIKYFIYLWIFLLRKLIWYFIVRIPRLLYECFRFAPSKNQIIIYIDTII